MTAHHCFKAETNDEESAYELVVAPDISTALKALLDKGREVYKLERIGGVMFAMGRDNDRTSPETPSAKAKTAWKVGDVAAYFRSQLNPANPDVLVQVDEVIGGKVTSVSVIGRMSEIFSPRFTSDLLVKVEAPR